jgi:hypothetical protein
MEKVKQGLINAAFFVGGDIAYSLFSFQKRNPPIFFGIVIVALLFFALHKIDKLIDEKHSKKDASQEKNYTNWMLSAFIGAGLAFSCNGSILLRWISCT